MFANITRTTLCLTAFSIATLMGAPLDATKTESLDWNWKFARFGSSGLVRQNGNTGYRRAL